MHAVRAAGLAVPKKLVSNTTMAAILTSFVGISYYWSMHSVGSTDLEKEVAREVRRHAQLLLSAYLSVNRLPCLVREACHATCSDILCQSTANASSSVVRSSASNAKQPGSAESDGPAQA